MKAFEFILNKDKSTEMKVYIKSKSKTEAKRRVKMMGSNVEFVGQIPVSKVNEMSSC